MKLLGILIMLGSLGFSYWWVTRENKYKGAVLSLCLIAIIAGLCLIIQDRIIELSVKGIGTIKTVTQQVQSDAKTVSDLTERIEHQSATVDLVASEASRAILLSEEVAEKNQRAQEKLATLDSTIAKAKGMLQSLDETTEFTLTVLAAQNDDRKAFDRLNQWANDNNYRFSTEAGKAWIKIFESHNNPFSLSNFTVPWPEGYDPSILSIAELSEQYSQAPFQIKPALLEYIWERDDIPKIERLDFMMAVMKNESSLTAVEYAGRHFTSGTNQKIKPMAVDYLENWWDEHRQEFEEE